MNNAKKIVCLVLVLMCILSACGAKEKTRTAVRVWYIEGTPGSASLLSCAKKYNAEREEGTAELLLTGFENEAALAEAFNTLSPELVYCSLPQAEQMYANGLLLSFSASEAVAEKISASRLETELTDAALFLPFGACVELMTAGDAQTPTDDFEELCAYASQRGAFIGIDSYGELFAALLSQRKAGFSGLRAEDVKNADYVYVYNLIAETALSGGIGGEDASCRFVSSAKLAREALQDTCIYPVPPIDEGFGFYAAECFGLVCVGSAKQALPFAEYYASLDLSALALADALIPLQNTVSAEAQGPLAAVLLEISRSYELFPLHRDSQWLSDKTSFDNTLAEAMSILAN